MSKTSEVQNEIVRQVSALGIKVTTYIYSEKTPNTITVHQARRRVNTEIEYVPGRDTYTVRVHKMTSDKKLMDAFMAGEEIDLCTTKEYEDVYADSLENFFNTRRRR